MNPVHSALGVGIIAVVLATGLAARARRAAEPPAPPAVATPAPVVAAVARSDSSPMLALDVGPGGHYQTTALTPLGSFEALVDTGATVVALTDADARRNGIYPRPEEYRARISTANGVSYAARAKLAFVRVGPIVVYDIDAIVMKPEAGNVSLLGMSFLSKLRGFEVAQNRLILRQ